MHRVSSVAGRGNSLVVLAASAGCVLAVLSAAAGLPQPVEIVAALILFGLAPGLALVGVREPIPLGLVVVVSLAVSVISSQVALWLGEAPGDQATYVLAAASLGLLTVRVVNA